MAARLDLDVGQRRRSRVITQRIAHKFIDGVIGVVTGERDEDRSTTEDR